MRFSTKLSLGIVSLLAAALCAVGIIMVGQSFAANLRANRAAAAASQYQTRQAIEKSVCQQGGGGYANAVISQAAQARAQQTGQLLSIYVDGETGLYSNLPRDIGYEVCRAVAQDGAGKSRLVRAGGGWYLLLGQPLHLPGRDAALLCAYDLTEVFATRHAQLMGWFGATVAVLAAGMVLALFSSRRLTAPLTRLQAAAARIAAGDYTGRTGIAGSDEIGAVSRSFDAMAAAVQAHADAQERTLRAQRDFIAAFTHEVKTPMTAMLGYADLMRARPQDPATQKEAADYIFRETRRLEALSRKLLALMELENLAEGEQGALQMLPVADRVLFRAVKAGLLPGETPLRLAPSGCVARVDRGLWEDLLRNLALNACRACREAGHGEVTLACRAEGGQAVFTVADTGCGIPAEDLPRLTEAFYMVDKSRARAGGGSGIGLTLCQKIAALHGTTLEFASAPGLGTTVTVRLPLEAQEEADEG